MFFKMSYLVFCRENNVMQVWNDTWMNKRLKNLYILVNYPFKLKFSQVGLYSNFQHCKLFLSFFFLLYLFLKRRQKHCRIPHIFPSSFLHLKTFCLCSRDSLPIALFSLSDLKTIRVNIQRPLREPRPLLCPRNLLSPACSLNQTYCHAVY